MTYGRIPSGSVVVSGSLPKADGSHSLVLRRDRQAGHVDAQTRSKTSINELAARLNHNGEKAVSGNMERVLRLMAEKNASDVYLSANTPILIKIHGQIMQLSDQLLTPHAAAPACWPNC